MQTSKNYPKKLRRQRPSNASGESESDIEDTDLSEEAPGEVEESEDNEEEDDEPVSVSVKRKRASINYANDLGPKETLSQDNPAVKRPKVVLSTRGVVVGVWRDSSEPSDEEKHVVFGFIDGHDRLRTRIHSMNRRGEEVLGNVPTGAGGCWVTFEKIIFDEHLKGLTSSEIKEYVKLRQETEPESDSDAKKNADREAVSKARTTTRQHESSPGSKTLIVRGARASLSRQSRQSLQKASMETSGFQTPKGSPSVEARSQGVLVGFWTESDGVRDEDKHAVFGVLSGVDSFRVKVARQTRDGRPRDGNFPTGAGALWIHYDKVVLEPHLRTCTRPEVKEYCRIRTAELRCKETEKERKVNEARAVVRAKEIVSGVTPKTNGNTESRRASHEFEPRHSTRSDDLNSKLQSEAQAATEVAIRTKKEQQDIRDKKCEKNKREFAATETLVTEAAEKELKSNMKKLNKVWVAQQAATIPGLNSASSEQEVRYHNGIKYERKKTGPFQGKLVSPAQILTIDGEDYVEYRILTKPSFG
ncbi:hypothetical protein K3495_g4960 [Podosphaera aphanis]|nr:hypothetical protein K3495_g4960 [Podosphaera aphanis]